MSGEKYSIASCDLTISIILGIIASSSKMKFLVKNTKNFQKFKLVILRIWVRRLWLVAPLKKSFGLET